MKDFNTSELPITAQGTVYHLDLKPENLAPNIFLVGDPGRVERVTKHFDEVTFKNQHREFITHTGILHGQPWSVISTGIGTSNIDIVLTELDVLANVDFNKRSAMTGNHSLNIVRIGTAGGLQPDVEVGDFILSSYAIGLDGLMHFYNYDLDSQEKALENQLNRFVDSDHFAIAPYVAKAHDFTFTNFAKSGITATCLGFYGPQNREVHLPLTTKDVLSKLLDLNFESLRCANFEMETAAILALGKALGHRCASLSVVLANRVTKKWASDPFHESDRLIEATIAALKSSTEIT